MARRTVRSLLRSRDVLSVLSPSLDDLSVPPIASQIHVWLRIHWTLVLSMAWICAGRPFDGHNLTFETLNRLLGQPLVRFVLPSVCLTSATFRAALYHI